MLLVGWQEGHPACKKFRHSNSQEFLQGVSIAASPVIAIVGKPSVRLSVRHTLARSENDAS